MKDLNDHTVTAADALMSVSASSIFDFGQLANIPQDAIHHPEGNVFTHTEKALARARLVDFPLPETKVVLLLAVVFHDIGKLTTTAENAGRITSHRHAQVGAVQTAEILNRHTDDEKFVERVATLVRIHMRPLVLVRQGSKHNAYRRLAATLKHIDVGFDLLVHLADCDIHGRGETTQSMVDHELELATFVEIMANVDSVSM